MQGNLDEFLSARVGAEEDNDDDAGPEIAGGSRAVSMQLGGAASIAATSIETASLNVQFRTTRRTLEEINRNLYEFLAARRRAEEDNVQFVISDSEGDSLIEHLLHCHR